MSHALPSRPAPPKASPPGARRGGRWSRTVRHLAATVALATGAALAGPGTAGASAAAPPEARATAALQRVASFGANPGGLNMYVYPPAALPNAPAVVALHGYTQSAQVYSDNAGLNTFADRHGFHQVVYDETTAATTPTSPSCLPPRATRAGPGAPRRSAHE
ncbi:feruloyl esterase [Streptomyces badius]